LKNPSGSADYGSFFLSSVTLENQFQKLDDFLKWFDGIKTNGNFTVNEIPFSKMDQWKFLNDKTVLAHQSGKFFTIEGIRVQTNFGGQKEWEQPIINQPEIGILGIITKMFNGTLYFLMQAKMEPGNINILQLSPTVQATKSNFSRVHKGKLPAYLEYFVDNPGSDVLIDQLQSEQGGRFLRKRNRNIVIRIQEEIEVLPDFCWLTLGEIKKLLEIDNFVNMDARSVISTIPLVDDQMIRVVKENLHGNTFNLAGSGLDCGDLNQELLRSICSEEGSYRNTDQIISWYTDQKVNYELNIESIPLSKLKSWKISDESIFNSNRYFSVIAVDVCSGTREVTSWTQPLFKDKNIGLLGFLLKKINGILHFLIQAKVEPGNLDIIELSPTVSCSNVTHLLESGEHWPPFMEYFTDNSHSRILFDTIQSEEGGRFYHVQNRNMIIEIDQALELELPGNYIWMTLSQMMDFMKYSMFNIEARSLVSSLNFLPKTV
jgi:dTDP-4-dehydro-6-deoxy-alpha-D-glucopyranose 2,3-dehydratase